MAPMYPNDARNERTGHKEGGSTGKQGAHGSGKVKCSADGGAKKKADFKPAAQVLGAPNKGELDVPGTGLMKGAHSVPWNGLDKGKPGHPMGGGSGIKKSKDAEDAGR